MRYLLLIPILYAAAVLETSLAGVIQVGHVTPDLLALVAVVWLLVVGGERSFLVAGAIGLAGDLIAPGRAGLAVACFLLVGYAVARLRKSFALDHLAAQVTTVLVAVTVLALELGFGRWLLGEASLPPWTLVCRAIGVGMYTAGISLPVLMVIGWIREPYRARQEKLANF